jgi:DeoR family transcriptional regulator, fructose operon transcriptional repressor
MLDGFNERQLSILERLRDSGEVEKLERAGHVRRTFGGAILASPDVALRDRVGEHAAEKERIGRAAAALVQPGDSVFIDGGSTTLQVARFLPDGVDVTVVTNAINVAAELSDKRIPTIVLGGSLLETTKSMVGHMTVEAASRMAFDKAFLGATGFHPKHGFSNSNMHEAEVKRAAIRQAKDAYVVLDHSKFGASMLVSFASMTEVRGLVTDRLPGGELEEAGRSAGLLLVAADAGGSAEA